MKFLTRQRSVFTVDVPLNYKSTREKQFFKLLMILSAFFGKYTIKDKDGNIVAKLKANDHFEVKIKSDTTFYIRYSGGFTTFKKAFAPANSVSRFSIGLSSGGASFYVEKI